MSTDPPQESPVRQYVRANRAVYAPDAIRRQLIEAGHPAYAVDQALAEEFGVPERGIDVRARTILVALGLFGAAALLIGFVFGSSGGRYVPDIVGSTLFALIYLLPGFLISLVVIAIVNRRPVAREQVTRAVLVGLAVPLLIAIAMTGFCLTGVRNA